MRRRPQPEQEAPPPVDRADGGLYVVEFAHVVSFPHVSHPPEW